MTSYYEIVVYLIGPLPSSMTFLYSFVAIIAALLTICACVSLILAPILFFKR